MSALAINRPGDVKRSRALGMLLGMALTLLLHASLVFAIVVGTIHSGETLKEKIAPKMLKFEEVELLALGVEKPPEVLPRISNPEKAVRPPDEVVIKQPNTPVINLKKKDDTKIDPNARKKKMADMLSALHNPNRPTNDDTPAGSEEGVVGGTAMKSMLNTYATKLLKEFNKYWTLPSTISLEEAKKFSNTVRVYVRISDTGTIVSYRFKKKSTNAQFNASIERVLKRYQVSGGRRTLPLPSNEDLKKNVLTQGLNLKKWKYTAK